MIETSAADAPKLTGRGAARRSALFEELVALLVGEGFARLTLDDLAARLRCSKRTLYGLVEAARSSWSVRRSCTSSDAPRPGSRRSWPLRPIPPSGSPPICGRFRPSWRRSRRSSSTTWRRSNRRRRCTSATHARRPARVQQLIEEGVRAGVFREVHVTFAADVISSVMVRIQRRQVAAATGLADAEAYEQLAELLLSGLRRA